MFVTPEGQYDICKSATTVKCVIRDGCQTGRQYDILKPATTVKCVIRDGCQTGRQYDILQSDTIAKCGLPDGCHSRLAVRYSLKRYNYKMRIARWMSLPDGRTIFVSPAQL